VIAFDDLQAAGKYSGLGRYACSPGKGAQTVIYLATASQIQGASGGYYFDCKELAPSPATQDDSVAQRLWDGSAKMVAGEQAA
jgi:hypothetical protein